jgi:predicted TIM-barrel fold metal-dependent hydrolase
MNYLLRRNCLLAFAAASVLCAPAQDLKYQPDPKAGEHMTLLLKDYDSKSMLHGAVHETPRAKFPVIDVRNHVDDAVRRGARGLKVLKDLGLGVKDKSGQFVAVDDPRLDPVWEECGRLGIPVAIHTSDPEAFFTPLDRHNERYEELNENPTWNFSDPQFPSKDKLLAERNHIVEKHPHTTFIALHVANWPENLDAVSHWLDRYPNMVVEFGAREAELGRQPRRARKFFLDYQDRILFGTDSEPQEAMYANYFRWLETADEYFPYAGYPGQGRWMIYGMELPDGVLEKVYHKNADRIFAQFKGTH